MKNDYTVKSLPTPKTPRLSSPPGRQGPFVILPDIFDYQLFTVRFPPGGMYLSLFILSCHAFLSFLSLLKGDKTNLP